MRNEILWWFSLAKRFQPDIKRIALCVLTVCAACLGIVMLTGAAESPGRWRFPCADGTIQIERAYEQPATRYSAGHRGIDFNFDACTSVFAPAPGAVRFAGMVAGRPLVSVNVDRRTVYSIEAIDTDLKVGDAVKTGDLLGTAVPGTHCTNSCLHLGVRVDDEYVNPMRFFYSKPVLLPW